MADTISEPTVLACNVPTSDHGWVCLATPTPPEKTSSVWMLTMGYPLSSEPLTELRRANVILPEETRVLDWMAGVYARLNLPGQTSPTQIAQAIIGLMTQVQRIATGEEVEITLEYISQ